MRGWWRKKLDDSLVGEYERKVGRCIIRQGEKWKKTIDVGRSTGEVEYSKFWKAYNAFVCGGCILDEAVPEWGSRAQAQVTKMSHLGQCVQHCIESTIVRGLQAQKM